MGRKKHYVLCCVRTKLTKKRDKSNVIKSLTFIHSLQITDKQ